MKFLLAIFILIVLAYALLWLSSVKSYPLEYGISFNQNYAASLGLDWKETYMAFLTDIKPAHVRIAAMWSDVEKKPGEFTFEDTDWMMERAAQAGAKVLLVVGQKAPRWPECHVPNWVYKIEDVEARKQHLFTYIEKTVQRYNNHPALELWQVENEPFIRFAFGSCVNYRPDLVKEEITIVRELDSVHRIFVTDSGELSTWRRAINAGDYFGTTLYRIVRTPRGWIWTYDWLPAAFYRWKAKMWGKDIENVFISELQAEPWFTGVGALETPLSEQEETMNPERLQKHLDYAARIGVPRAYLWGVEWWYWMKEKNNDARYWEIIKKQIANSK